MTSASAGRAQTGWSRRSEVTPERGRFHLSPRALTILSAAAVAVVVAIGVGTRMVDERQQRHDAATLRALQNDKVVTVSAQAGERDDTLLERVYKYVPSDVYTSLRKYLDAQEVDNRGNFVGLKALQGYELPGGGQGLVFNEPYADFFQQQNPGA